MPPRKQMERQDILERAFLMTRQEGFEALTARSLAASLGCSTQPIYQAFHDMKALERAVAERAAQVLTQALQQALTPERPDELSLALAYMRFAQTEGNLFRIIAHNGLFRTFPQTDGARALPRVDQRLIFFINGILFMTAFQSVAFSWEQVERMTTDAYHAFLQYDHGKASDDDVSPS